MIEQLKKFCDKTRSEIDTLKGDIKNMETKAYGGLDGIRDSLLYLKKDYRSKLLEEIMRMGTLNDQKHKVEIEVQIVIKKLVHPQAKEDYDEEVETKIILKSNLIFLMFYSNTITAIN